MKKISVAFTGPSNSGKTTAIVKIAEILTKKYKVAIIKNDPGDKAKFDIEGKDSWKFSKTGANVAVVSPTRTTVFLQEQRSIKEVSELLGDYDILIVEGLKYLDLPRIGIFRNKIDTDYFPYINAIACDDSVDISSYDIPENIEILNLNDTDEIIDWIFKNGVEND
ncbi:MAG: molybdopterin-guanine dinucleotide biosynthesis protein B [Epsilonproteobacteria bacterium]|nr:molybdopterin-guanine dinucleotide biosynthesis protein B [Campylobacterota bacterium]